MKTHGDICPWDYSAEIEVRYAETDAMGVVHHAVYPVWFEQARIGFLRTHGLPFTTIEAQGWRSPVVGLAVEYLKAAQFGDFVTVQARLSRDGLRFRFDYRILRRQDLLAQGHSLHVFTREGRPCRLPPLFLNHFFAAEPVADTANNT